MKLEKGNPAEWREEEQIHGFMAWKQLRANSISHLLKAVTVKRSNPSANRSFGSSRGTRRGNPTEKQGSNKKGQLRFSLFQPIPFGSGGARGGSGTSQPHFQRD